MEFKTAKNEGTMKTDELISTVLIVDDDAEYASLLAMGFKSRGFETIEAKNAADALALMLGGFKGTIAAVLTDLHMSDGSGPDLARAMGLLRSKVPVYFMTGDPGFDATQALQLGAKGILYKPFDTGEAVKRIAAAIEERKSGVTKLTGTPKSARIA